MLGQRGAQEVGAVRFCQVPVAFRQPFQGLLPPYRAHLLTRDVIGVRGVSPYCEGLRSRHARVNAGSQNGCGWASD